MHLATRATGHFKRVPGQAKASHIGECMHAGQCRQVGARSIQARGGVEHPGISAGIEFALLERRRHDAHAERLAQYQHIAGLSVGIALDPIRMHEPQGHQPIDGLH